MIIKKHIISKRLYYLKLYGQIEGDSLAVDTVRLEDIFNEIARRVTKQTHFLQMDFYILTQGSQKSREKNCYMDLRRFKRR